MRIKPLLIASAAVALSLPVLAQQAPQPTPAPATGPARLPANTVAPATAQQTPTQATGGETSSDETAVEEVANLNLPPSPPPVEYPGWARRDPRIVGSFRPRARRSWSESVGRGQRRFPVDPDAADGCADRLAVGAHRVEGRASRQGARAARREPGRLGGRARVAPPAVGRSRCRADACRRSRYRPLHPQDGAGRGAERVGKRGSARALPD